TVQISHSAASTTVVATRRSSQMGSVNVQAPTRTRPNAAVAIRASAALPGVLSPFESSAKSAGVTQFARTYCTQSPLFRQKECLSRYFPLHNSHRPLHRLFIPAVHNADDAAALLFFVPAPHCASIKRMTNASTPRAATTPFILGP